MAQTLQMIFRNEEGRNVTISIADAKDELDPLDVETVMNNIISGNLFITQGGEIIKAIRGQLISRYVQTIVEF